MTAKIPDAAARCGEMAALGVAVDEEIARQRASLAGQPPVERELVIKKCAKCGARLVGKRLAPCCLSQSDPQDP